MRHTFRRAGSIIRPGGIAVSVVGEIFGYILLYRDKNASLVFALSSTTLLVFGLAVLYDQRKTNNTLASRIATKSEKDDAVASLVALRREFGKNQKWFRGAASNPEVPNHLLQGLVDRLQDAADVMRPLSIGVASEFADLLAVFISLGDSPRRSVVVDLLDDGLDIFERAINRLSETHASLTSSE